MREGNGSLPSNFKPLKRRNNMSVQETGTCEVCGSATFRYSDYRELLNEDHCLNEDCGFFKVESEKEENWSGSDYRTPEEVREFIEEFIEEHEHEDLLDGEPLNN